ncbi:MAG TPA: NAD-dependent epimerase [Acidobacteriota bacterium]|nr:NAD-dependent epimerase [Acidobacteriota bacterium]
MSKQEKRILVTGAAGFIGFHLTRRLLRSGEAVEGLDHFSPYYDPELKEARLERLLQERPGFVCRRIDLADRRAAAEVFEDGCYSHVVHLAAQPGVRYSLQEPHAYLESNITGFLNVLEGCRRIQPRHLVYASSSSVYGANRKLPLAESDRVDHPLSLYGATKKSNEMMAHCYAHLYRIPVTGLRLFTVYGPWGRPDMAFFKFVRAILKGEEIEVYNQGKMERDFTYVDDIVEGMVRVLQRPARPHPQWDAENPLPDVSDAPFRTYNIGCGRALPLLDFIAAIEDALGKKARIRYLPMQPGDVLSTAADVSKLEKDFGYRPDTRVRQGIEKFVQWYRRFYGV